MAYDTKTFLIQTGLDFLGFPFGPGELYGKLDGDAGPKTQAAIDAFEDSRKLHILAVGSGAGGTIAARLVGVATRQLILNIRETSKNQGPELAKFWTATSYLDGYRDRQPYCAAFVCWCVREAVTGTAIAFSLPQSPVAYDFERWAAANADKGVSMHDTPKPGDIFTLATASHCGIVVSVEGSTIITIEGNTDATGGREGDGVYKRSRSISSIRHFIRIQA
jgi:peptidoglycan hydrolase-like protein with peptidoglycan-binding domain